jgi:uncharacterized membrane protein YfcA
VKDLERQLRAERLFGLGIGLFIGALVVRDSASAWFVGGIGVIFGLMSLYFIWHDRRKAHPVVKRQK